MVGGGKKLKDVLPPDLHARFAAQRSKVRDDADKWERYRPIIAAAFLQQAAFHQVNLSMRLDLGAALRILAKKHGVRVEEVKVAGVSDMLEALKTMPPADRANLRRGLAHHRGERLAAAGGARAGMGQRQRRANREACRNSRKWMPAATPWMPAKARSMSSAAFARPGLKTSKNICAPRARRSPWSTWTCMLERGGLLDQLRAKGYEIDAP